MGTFVVREVHVVRNALARLTRTTVIWWSSQASIQAGEDAAFLALAAQSGGKQFVIGRELIAQASMHAVHKRIGIRCL